MMHTVAKVREASSAQGEHRQPMRSSITKVSYSIYTNVPHLLCSSFIIIQGYIKSFKFSGLCCFVTILRYCTGFVIIFNNN